MTEEFLQLLQNGIAFIGLCSDCQSFRLDMENRSFSCHQEIEIEPHPSIVDIEDYPPLMIIHVRPLVRGEQCLSKVMNSSTPRFCTTSAIDCYKSICMRKRRS